MTTLIMTCLKLAKWPFIYDLLKVSKMTNYYDFLKKKNFCVNNLGIHVVIIYLTMCHH